MALSDDIAVLEKAHAEGKLTGRHLEVIAMQLARAEDKILKRIQSNPLMRIHFSSSKTN